MSDLNEDDEKYHFGTDLTSETTPGMASQLEPPSGDYSVYHCIIVAVGGSSIHSSRCLTQLPAVE